VTTPAWLDRHLNRACVVFTRMAAAKDEYGNVIYVEIENPTRCFLQPIAQEEIQDGTGQLSQFLVHLPASIVGILDGFARLEIDGTSYEAVEQPALFTSLTVSGVHHVELIVQEAKS
jgi:hypothetical protein